MEIIIALASVFIDLIKVAIEQPILLFIFLIGSLSKMKH